MRQNLVALIKSISENIKSHTEVIAMIITAKGETIPALTAASPKTKAPTILIEVPIKDGILISLSLNISKVKVKIRISKKIINYFIYTTSSNIFGYNID